MSPLRQQRSNFNTKRGDQMTDNGNLCGTCTLCCKLTSVPELKKPVGKWCRHCKPGKGCGIYDDRPESCKNFRCVWLSGGLPPDLRPDKSRVIFERMPTGKTFIVLVNEGYGDSWKEPGVREYIANFLKANKAVVIVTKPPLYFIPKGRTKEEVLTDLREAAELYGIKIEK